MPPSHPGPRAAQAAHVAGQMPCLCGALRRASRAVTRLYDEHLAACGLRTTQYSLLRVLAEAGPLKQHQLAGVILADSTTLSRTLAPLRARGWLTEAEGEDRREKLWSITPAGRRKLDAATPAWAAAQDEMGRRLGGVRWDDLMRSLTLVGTLAA